MFQRLSKLMLYSAWTLNSYFTESADDRPLSASTKDIVQFRSNVSSTVPGTENLQERAPSIPCLLEDGYKAEWIFSLKAPNGPKHIPSETFPTQLPSSLSLKGKKHFLLNLLINTASLNYSIPIHTTGF